MRAAFPRLILSNRASSLEVLALYESGVSWFLDDATAAQAASANDAHTDKGPLYELIAHHYLSSEHS